ncbi:MAG: 2,3-butanediol dehydrogenase [Oscillospiraceae bacterium]|nr:2,3-butanediol dehydrogenase [Oscillospiraceae bacterium]
MKAARFYSSKDLRVDQVPDVAPVGDEVRIQVKWCGICGSDLQEYLDGPIFTPGNTPQYVTGCVNPVTMGHEFSGVVVAVGPDCKKLKVGDRVIPEPLVVCGDCPSCETGNLNVCEHLSFLGFVSDNGGFAEYCNFTEKLVHKMPEGMSFEQGAIVEPLSVGYHSLKVGHFKAGQTAVVAGAGPIGLATIACLKALGAAKIIAVQRQSVRQEYAKNTGADVVLDPNVDDVVAEVRRLTNGRGADVAFETTSSEQCFHLLRDCIRPHGYEVITSIWVQDITMNPNVLVMSEKNIVGSICYNGPDFEEVIDLLSSGRLSVPGYITKRVYLDDIVKEGFATLTGPEKKAQVKILVTPERALLES